jgi:hypothetical protein
MKHRPEKLPWLGDLTDYDKPALVMLFLLSGFPVRSRVVPAVHGLETADPA